jgi:hypothetical protein
MKETSVNVSLTLRKCRRTLAVAAVAGAAALGVAGPAQANTLHRGVTNGGCLQGVQVGSITQASGDTVPVCMVIN